MTYERFVHFFTQFETVLMLATLAIFLGNYALWVIWPSRQERDDDELWHRIVESRRDRQRRR
jgi:hypothetical protein